MRKFALLIIMFLALSSAAMAKGSGSSAAPPVLLFYENACASCDVDKQLYREIYAIPEIQALRGDFRIVSYNLFHEVQDKYFLRILEMLSLERRDVAIPCIIAGGKAVPRSDWDAQLSAAIQTEMSAPADYLDFYTMLEEINASKSESPAPAASIDTIYYFYMPLCADCSRARREIEAFAQAFADYHIDMLDISQAENLQTFHRFAADFGVSEEETAVPIVFYSGGYLPNDMITYDNLDSARNQIRGEIPR